MMISKDEEEVAETLFGLADMFTNKTSDALLSDDDKETTKVDSVLVVETGFTTKDESLEPAVSVLSSDKTKQLDEIPLQQSSSVNVTDAPVSTKPTTLYVILSWLRFKLMILLKFLGKSHGNKGCNK